MEHTATVGSRPNGAPTAGTRLTGPRLRLAQGLWLVITLTVIALQFVGLPALYRQLGTVCAATTVACEEIGQPTAAQAAVFTAEGLTLDRYAALAGQPLPQTVLDEVIDLGLLSRDGDRICTTDKGVMMLNGILRALLADRRSA